MTIEETILARLATGPCWSRSFQVVKPVLERLVASGRVERCRPPLGRARNMVRLAVVETAESAARSERDARAERDAWLDLFAAGLERDLSVADAARALGKSASWGTGALAEIRARLGEQAC